MIKHFCDRCKKEIDNWYVMELYGETKLEICEDCDKKLGKFLKEDD